MRQFWISLFICLSSGAVAAESAAVVTPEGEPIGAFSGLWQLIEQKCSSGAMPNSPIDFRRDKINLRISSVNPNDPNQAADFEHSSYIRGCDYWVRGHIRTQGQVMYFYDLRGASTCSGFAVRDRDSMFYHFDNNRLSLFQGPVYRSDWICPSGESLENIYIRTPSVSTYL